MVCKQNTFSSKTLCKSTIKHANNLDYFHKKIFQVNPCLDYLNQLQVWAKNNLKDKFSAQVQIQKNCHVITKN